MKLQNKKDVLGTNTKDHPRQAVMKTNKDNNNNNNNNIDNDDDDTVDSKLTSDNYEQFQATRDDLMGKSKAYSLNSHRHMSSTLMTNDTDFNVNMQSAEQGDGSMSMHQQHYSLDCLAYETRDENNNNTNSRNPHSRPSNRYDYFDQNKSEPNPRDYITMPMSVSQSSSFGNDDHDTYNPTYNGVADCDAQNPTGLLSYLRHSTSGLSVDSTAHSVHNLAKTNYVHGIQNKKIDNKAHQMHTCNSNQFFNPIKPNSNNTLISKQKPKPQPITIPSTISTSFCSIYPQMTLLKSPHFNFESSAKNQYTPPPMLSPFRKGTGLFLNNTNRQHMFTLPFSRQFSLGSFYSNNDTWSNSCTNVNNSTILSMASTAIDACDPDAYKNNGTLGVQFQTQTSKVSLLRTRISTMHV